MKCKNVYVRTVLYNGLPLAVIINYMPQSLKFCTGRHEFFILPTYWDIKTTIFNNNNNYNKN